MDGEKMSKSLGNFFTVREVLDKFDPEVLRFFILRAHYRSPLNYSDKHLEDARLALSRMYTALKDVDSPSHGSLPIDWQHAFAHRFKEAMDDDFNSGAAISVLFDLLRSLNRHIDQHGLDANSSDTDPEVQTLIDATRVLRQLSNVLGLFVKPIVGSSGDNDADSQLLDEVMHLLIDLRKDARANKDYATADVIRNRLTELGIALLDKKDGTNWERSS